MGIFSWLKGLYSEDEYDAKLMREITENHQPSMRVVDCGGRQLLTMDPEAGRRTAKIHGESKPFHGDQ